jgi:hypothetical protein
VARHTRAGLWRRGSLPLEVDSVGLNSGRPELLPFNTYSEQAASRVRARQWGDRTVAPSSPGWAAA